MPNRLDHKPALEQFNKQFESGSGFGKKYRKHELLSGRGMSEGDEPLQRQLRALKSVLSGPLEDLCLRYPQDQHH